MARRKKMKKETILKKKQARVLRREQLPSKETEEKILLLQEKMEKKRKDQERRRIRRKKQFLQKQEDINSAREKISESEDRKENSPVENDLPIDEPPEKPSEETSEHFVMRPHSRKFLREKDEQLNPCKGMMATVQEKYKTLTAKLPTSFEEKRLLLRQWRGLSESQ